MGGFVVGGGAGGGSGGGLILLEQHTASNSATLDFTTGVSSAYDNYMVMFIGVTPVNNAAFLAILMSTNGGASYDGSAIYSQIVWYVNTGPGTGSGGATTNTSFNFGTISNNANYGVSGSARLYALPLSVYKSLEWDCVMSGDGTATTWMKIAGVYRNIAPVNAFRVMFLSGNIASGIVRVYGIAKS